MSLKLTLYMLMACQISWSQSQWQDASLDEFKNAIIHAEQQVPSNTSYSFDSHYMFYNDITTNQTELEMDAQLICKDGKELYIDQFGRYIVQNDMLNVVCDTVTHMIILNDPNPDLFSKKATSDFAALKETNCKVQKKAVGSEIAYSLRFPEGFSYLGAEIWINTTTSQAKKYILYSNQEVVVEKDGVEVASQPRMEVTFKNYLSGKNVPLSKMKKITDYVVIKEDGNFQLNENYSTYELIDLRTTNEN